VPLHGSAPATALGSRAVWHAEVAVVLLAVCWVAARALTFAWHGRLFWIRPAGERPDER
jgi:hypothetical protein